MCVCDFQGLHFKSPSNHINLLFGFLDPSGSYRGVSLTTSIPSKFRAEVPQTWNQSKSALTLSQNMSSFSAGNKARLFHSRSGAKSLSRSLAGNR